jgi:hypothetical protein
MPITWRLLVGKEVHDCRGEFRRRTRRPVISGHHRPHSLAQGSNQLVGGGRRRSSALITTSVGTWMRVTASADVTTSESSTRVRRNRIRAIHPKLGDARARGKSDSNVRGPAKIRCMNEPAPPSTPST